MKDYHINVFRSDEDGCHIADITDLNFCSACGANSEDGGSRAPGRSVTFY